MSPTSVLVNGEEGNGIVWQDRGFQYGDGLFETIAVRQGRATRWDRHLRRLTKGCARLGLACPRPALLEQEARRLCSGHGRAVLKIIVTAGVGGRGYRRVPGIETTRVLSIQPWPDYPASFNRGGVKLRLCDTRLGINPVLAGLKHLNRLEQVLARNEWDAPDIPEGLMQDVEGRIIEGTMSNVFIVRDEHLLTPELSGCGVEGVMRTCILGSAAPLGLSVAVQDVYPEDLDRADEVFVSNSLIGVWPVREIDAKPYPFGEITRRIMQGLEVMF